MWFSTTLHSTQAAGNHKGGEKERAPPLEGRTQKPRTRSCSHLNSQHLVTWLHPRALYFCCHLETWFLFTTEKGDNGY